MSLQRIKLHIVSFDIPDPPDYGGAVDVFYKVKNLAAEGAEVYLHCPEYAGRRHSAYLDSICAKVWYYPRKTGLQGISLYKPYAVYSRRSKELLRNLRSVDAPILFDGVSTTYYLSHPALRNRLKIIRNQNVERDYYAKLAEREPSILKKLYYLLESELLHSYEKKLHAAQAFFTVAMHDHSFFKKRYPNAIHKYIPSFQPYDEVNSLPGKGDYALYHGNLALAENNEAAVYLVKNIFPYVNIRCVIAGRNPATSLKILVDRCKNCTLIPNPSMDEMDKLIREAQVHVLPTFQDTGLKLKLLHALFNGRHVVVNEAMVRGTGLNEVCTVTDTKEEMIQKIGILKTKPFDEIKISGREKLLTENYNNKKNARRILTFLQQKSL